MKSLPRKKRRAEALQWEQDVACCTEATGLLPALPQHPRQRRALLSLYALQRTPNQTGWHS
ncbi:MAG: hypothetical protein Q4A66_06575 [Eubacteriales bacterium]|nr:hypothetical protein [Eubacteriales bacterium]